MAVALSSIKVTLVSNLSDGDTISFGHKVEGGEYTAIRLIARTTPIENYEFEIGATFTATVSNYATVAETKFGDLIEVSNTGYNSTEISNMVHGVYFSNTEASASNVRLEHYTEYRERLYYEFQDIDGFNKRVSILDDDYDGQPYEVCGTDKPFTIEYPQKDPFNPIKGSGCQIEFLYKGDESFVREMFTSDINRFRVVLRDLNTNLIDWSGFLNSELYEEDYGYDGEETGIVYSMTGNDGFANLSRYRVTDEHQDTLTLYSVLKMCAPIIGLDLEDVESFNRTLSENVQENDFYCNSDIDLIPSYENDSSGEGGAYGIFGNVYLNKTNYLDEDGKYLTLREVLEETLRPYRLHVVKVGSNVRIQSINTRVSTGSDILYDAYDVQRNSYIAGYYLISNDLHTVGNDSYYQSGQRLTSIPKINEQVVAVDNYIDEDVFINELSSGDKFLDQTTFEDAPETEDWSWGDNQFLEHDDYDTTDILPTTTIPTLIKPSKLHKVDSSEKYAILIKNPPTHQGTEILNEPSSLTLLSKKKASTSIMSGQTGFKLTVSALLQHDMANYLKNDAVSNSSMFGFSMEGYLKYGNRYLKANFTEVSTSSDITHYTLSSFSWTTTPSTFPLIFSETEIEGASTTKAEGVWVSLCNYGYSGLFGSDFLYYDELGQQNYLEIPPLYNHKEDSGVDNDSGYLEFGIGKTIGAARFLSKNLISNLVELLCYGTTYSSIVNDPIDYIAIEDIQLETTESQPSEKMEFVRTTDDSWKEEGESVELLHGTSCMYNYGIYPNNPLLERGTMYVTEVGSPNSYVPINSIEVEKIKEDTSYSGAFLHENGNSDIIENLLMNSLMANRGSVLQELSLSLNSRYADFMKIIQMPDLPNRKLMFTGGEIDMFNRSISGTWREIKGD